MNDPPQMVQHLWVFALLFLLLFARVLRRLARRQRAAEESLRGRTASTPRRTPTPLPAPRRETTTARGAQREPRPEPASSGSPPIEAREPAGTDLRTAIIMMEVLGRPRL
jgi:hypothetical protein